MTAPGAAEPSLDRPVTLRMMGDWGTANLHRVCGWIGQEVVARAPGSRFAIWNGRGYADNLRALADMEVDVAMATPAAFAVMAREGLGPFSGRRLGNLRSLGQLPHRDRFVLAINADVGVASFAEIRDRRPPLKIALSPNDGVHFGGMAAYRVLELSGCGREAIEAWGGRLLEYEQPFPCLEAVECGSADAVFQEAIMTPSWQRLGSRVRLNYVAIEPNVLERLESRLRWPSAQVESGYLPGLGRTLTTLDASDYLVATRSDLADDLAYLVAWVLGETGDVLAAQYLHLPAERTPIGFPLRPQALASTSIPLHDAAAHYYAEAAR
jgi:TRAP-type uncharacterized transport system substrate-binding protein